MSFASMFSATTTEDHLAGADGFTSVPLQRAGSPGAVPVQAEADAAASPPDSPSPTPPAPADVSAAIPAAANTSEPKIDLDEMARQLFEPLSARLRAELWLDRERAGMIADVRH